MTNEPNNLDAQVVSTALAVTNAVDSMANDSTSAKTKKNIVVDNKPTDLGDRLEKGLKDLGAKFDKNIKGLGDRFDKNIKALGVTIVNSIEKQISNQNKFLDKKLDKFFTNKKDSITSSKPVVIPVEDKQSNKVTKQSLSNIENHLSNIEILTNKLVSLSTNTKESKTDEKSKWQRISKIIGETIEIGKYASKEEANRLETPKPGILSRIKNVITPVREEKKEVENKEKKSGGWLLKLAVIIGALIAFAPQIKDLLVKFGPTIKEAIGKIGIWWDENKPMILDALTDIGRYLKDIIIDVSPTLLERIKSIGKKLFECLKGLGPELLLKITAVGTAILAVMSSIGASLIGVVPVLIGTITTGAAAALGNVLGENVGTFVSSFFNGEVKKGLSLEESKTQSTSILAERNTKLTKAEKEQLEKDKAEWKAKKAAKAISPIEPTITSKFNIFAEAAKPPYTPVTPSKPNNIQQPPIDNKEELPRRKFGLEYQIPKISNKLPLSKNIGNEGKEMQDFIVKGNSVYTFNNKDEILGMKDGGAVKQLLTNNAQNNDKQLFISSKQVSILEQIRDGIITLTKSRSADSSVTNIHSNSNNTKSIPSQNFLRSDFNIAHNLQPI